MQMTKQWLYNYFLPVAISVLLLAQGLNQNLEISTAILHIAGGLLLLAVALRLGLLLKNEWQHHQYEQKLQELAIDYWRQKAELPFSADSRPHWNGWRIFTVSRKITESEDIVSFYLKPHDGKPLPAFHPGQYLTVQIRHPQQNKVLTRCYSLSDSHSPDYYRISVKKEAQGMVSGYLHQQISEGDILEIKAPSGEFYLNLEKPHPVVLIAGGVGITPLLSMINTLVKADDKREIHLFYGVRNGRQIMMKPYLQELAQKWPLFKLHLCYSRPLPEDEDYQHRGRVNIELLRSTLPSCDYHYYLCGSVEMMQGLSRDLKDWGVADEAIYFESFGTSKPVIEETGETHSVFFRKSNKLLLWSAKEGSLLDLAEKNDIPIESACRSGQCGMCQTKVEKGEFEYLSEPAAAADDGHCLSCVSIPKGELAIDL